MNEERLKELHDAARAKIAACEAVEIALIVALVNLEKVPRTVGLQAQLTGVRAMLANEQAAANIMLADVISIVGEATKAGAK